MPINKGTDKEDVHKDICNEILFSHLKEQKILILSEVIRQRKTNIICYHLYMES